MHMHHRSDISPADVYKFRECDTNFLLTVIFLTSGVAMLNNFRLVFEPKLTRTEFIECNIYSSVFGS